MDYKKQIIEMLEKIDNIYWLRSIYVFMKTLYGGIAWIIKKKLEIS